jgi:hypothetical protein
MMKIIASLIILGLCANVRAYTVAPTSSSQGSAFSGLNSTATKVYTVSNQSSDSAWDSTALSTTVTIATGIPKGNVMFGPGATNDTSYVYGYILSSPSTVQQITKIVKRTVNNTIAGNSSDTTEASIQVADAVISSSIVSASTPAFAVGPGYLAILSQGSDGTNNQVWITLLTGSSPSTTKVTSITDIVSATQSVNQGCTTTTFTLGNVWYDIGAGAFFYTYSKKVATYTGAAANANCGSTSPTYVNTIYLGGIFATSTATAYWPSPLALTPATPANAPSYIMGGGDNWLNSSNIYVVYKDTTVSTGGANSATGITYSSKTTKANTTTAGGSFTALVSDTITGTPSTTTLYTSTYYPSGVWSSNYTFGIVVQNYSTSATTSQQTATTSTPTYTITNYLNSTLTATDSGISYSSATGINSLWGWPLSTGYTLVASWQTATSGLNAYTWGTFYGNGTVNMTATTLGSVQGPVSFYEDVNGTQWIGWTDYDTSANSPVMTTAGYLAKLQGQLNVASGANILSALSVFALFLVSIFAF